MIINGKEVSANDLLQGTNLRDSFHNVINGNLYLSDYQIGILERNQITYQNCQSMSELSFMVEQCLNEIGDIDSELEDVAKEIAEYRYYHDTNH